MADELKHAGRSLSNPATPSTNPDGDPEECRRVSIRNLEARRYVFQFREVEDGAETTGAFGSQEIMGIKSSPGPGKNCLLDPLLEERRNRFPQCLSFEKNSLGIGECCLGRGLFHETEGVTPADHLEDELVPRLSVAKQLGKKTVRHQQGRSLSELYQRFDPTLGLVVRDRLSYTP